MTFWTENAVGKIPGRCQLSSKKCGNKHHFSLVFQRHFFYLFIEYCAAVMWMWPGSMNRNGQLDASGSFPLCCPSGVAFCGVCEWQAFLVCFPPPRDPTETISTILPCSRQCWRRIEMEARAAKRTQVCGSSDGKANACFQATAGPAPQNVRMLCERGKLSWMSFTQTRIFFNDCEGRLKP